MSSSEFIVVLLRTIYKVLFPSPLREKVSEKFQSESWIEFCNRLVGIGILMAVMGGITLLLQEADLNVQVGELNLYGLVFKILNPVMGIFFLIFLWMILHIVGWAAADEFPLPFRPEGRRANIAFNVLRIVVGAAILTGMFLLIGRSSWTDRTLLEEIITFASSIGLLSVFLFPIFFGLGVLGRGLFELFGEYRWRK